MGLPRKAASGATRPDCSSAAIDAARASRDLWVHEFRNALGNTTIAAEAARSLLERHEEHIDRLMRQIEEGCERCLQLLHTMPR